MAVTYKSKEDAGERPSAGPPEGDQVSADVDPVLGVDACKGGWVGVRLDRNSTSAYFAPGIDELVAATEHGGPLAVVAIDIPIGLPDRGPRAADLLARTAIGSRRASVFMTPVREALATPDHRTAGERSRELTGALDAAVAAWTARRVATGAAVSRPDHPVTGSPRRPWAPVSAAPARARTAQPRSPTSASRTCSSSTATPDSRIATVSSASQLATTGTPANSRPTSVAAR